MLSFEETHFFRHHTCYKMITPLRSTHSCLVTKDALLTLSHTFASGSRVVARPSKISYFTFRDVPGASKRSFTSTSRAQLQEFFPPPRDAPHIKTTTSSWHHPVYAFTSSLLQTIGPRSQSLFQILRRSDERNKNSSSRG